MEDLIQRLQTEAGLTQDQAAKSLEVIMNYVKEKFPMFGGAINNLFDSAEKDDDVMP
jgi:hypothetical protein